MSSCPHCQKQIEIKEEHYGTLYRCAYCKTEFFVDFSGQPENSKEAPPIEEDKEQVASFEPQPESTGSENAAPSGFDFLNSPVQPLENASENGFSTSYEESVTPLMTDPVTPVAEPQEHVPMNSAEPEPESFGNQGNSFINEISDFGNEVQAYTGILNLNLTIDEIDLPDQKNLLLEQLEDKRFGFDMEEVKEKLKYGKLEIHNLPVSKAVVLIHRLQGLSLKISWSENVITQ